MNNKKLTAINYMHVIHDSFLELTIVELSTSRLIVKDKS